MATNINRYNNTKTIKREVVWNSSINKSQSYRGKSAVFDIE